MSTESLQLSHEDRAADGKTALGFWIYLMTDFVLFASLFSVFIVLRGDIYSAHAGAGLFDMRGVFAETVLLLTSSLTCGLMLLSARAGHMRDVYFWMYATALLGFGFVALEVSEFAKLIAEGYTPQSSGFLSAFFTLVGTHGLHVSLGLVWLAALIGAVSRRGLTRGTMRKLMLFGMFWHFLDVVWIFIFTIVYMMGNI